MYEITALLQRYKFYIIDQLLFKSKGWILMLQSA